MALASRYCSFIVGAAYALLAGALVCVVGRNSGHAFTSDAFFFVAVSWQVLALTLSERIAQGRPTETAT